MTPPRNITYDVNLIEHRISHRVRTNEHGGGVHVSVNVTFDGDDTLAEDERDAFVDMIAYELAVVRMRAFGVYDPNSVNRQKMISYYQRRDPS